MRGKFGAGAGLEIVDRGVSRPLYLDSDISLNAFIYSSVHLGLRAKVVHSIALLSTCLKDFFEKAFWFNSSTDHHGTTTTHCALEPGKMPQLVQRL